MEANLERTDFLDIHLDLELNSYKPYKKVNQESKYVDVRSNHPQSVLKHLPSMIGHRLSNLSSSEDTFLNEIGPYEDALKRAGHTKFNYTSIPSSKPP